MTEASTFAEKAEEAEKLASLSEQSWVRLNLKKLARTYRAMAVQEAARSKASAGVPATHGAPIA